MKQEETLETDDPPSDTARSVTSEEKKCSESVADYIDRINRISFERVLDRRVGSNIESAVG